MLIFHYFFLKMFFGVKRDYVGQSFAAYEFGKGKDECHSEPDVCFSYFLSENLIKLLNHDLPLTTQDPKWMPMSLCVW